MVEKKKNVWGGKWDKDYFYKIIGPSVPGEIAPDYHYYYTVIDVGI